MTRLQQTELTLAQKIHCAAQALGRQAHGVITALSMEFGVSRHVLPCMRPPRRPKRYWRIILPAPSAKRYVLKSIRRSYIVRRLRFARWHRIRFVPSKS